MAHIEKFKKTALGNMFGHYDRSANTSGRDNIDPSLTHLNYNLAESVHTLSQWDFLNQRLSEVKVQNRKDVNLVCTCAITVPKSLDPREYEKFFKSAFRSLARRYGKENVISAYVHMDEPHAKPHMHFAFVPVTHDYKKGIDKVSAKEVVNRLDLQTLHKGLQADISRDLGHRVEILNGATKNGNKTVSELKRDNPQNNLLSTLNGANIAYLREENERLEKQVRELSKIVDSQDKDFDFFLDK